MNSFAVASGESILHGPPLDPEGGFDRNDQATRRYQRYYRNDGHSEARRLWKGVPLWLPEVLP